MEDQHNREIIEKYQRFPITEDYIHSVKSKENLLHTFATEWRELGLWDLTKWRCVECDNPATVISYLTSLFLEDLHVRDYATPLYKFGADCQRAVWQYLHRAHKKYGQKVHRLLPFFQPLLWIAWARDKEVRAVQIGLLLLAGMQQEMLEEAQEGVRAVGKRQG